MGNAPVKHWRIALEEPKIYTIKINLWWVAFGLAAVVILKVCFG